MNPSRDLVCADRRLSLICRLMDETLTDILCHGEGLPGVVGPRRGRLNGPGGTTRQRHAGHSEGTSMFRPYMMLHVLFFLGLLRDVTGAELPPP